MAFEYSLNRKGAGMTYHDTKPLGDPVTHYWLAQSMAKAAGVDLAAEMAAGRLDQAEWAGVVERCRGCGWEREGGGCARWLARQDAGEAEVPGTCENVDVFARLIAGEMPDAAR